MKHEVPSEETLFHRIGPLILKFKKRSNTTRSDSSNHSLFPDKRPKVLSQTPKKGTSDVLFHRSYLIMPLESVLTSETPCIVFEAICVAIVHVKVDKDISVGDGSQKQNDSLVRFCAFDLF